MTTNLYDWKKILTETCQASTPTLINWLGYNPPDYKGDTSLVSKFFSNLNLPVFTTSLQGVLSGAIMSKHSRTESDLRRWLHDHLRVEFKQPEAAALQERMRNAFEKLCIPDLVQEFGTEFFERTFSEYGDDSVAQVVPVTAGFENVSMLYAMGIFHHRLISGIEKSTRYKAFDVRDKQGEYSYFRDPLLARHGLLEKFVEETDELFDTYAAYLHTTAIEGIVFREHLTKKVLPFDRFCDEVNKACDDKKWNTATEEELRKAYERTVVPMHLDNIRHALPLSARTMLGILMNGQNARDIITQGYSVPTSEFAIMTELLRRELQPSIGPLLKDLDLNSTDNKSKERAWNAIAFRRNTMDVGRNMTVPQAFERTITGKTVTSGGYNLRYFQPSERGRYAVVVEDPLFGFRVEMATKATRVDIAEAIIKEHNPSLSLFQADRLVTNMLRPKMDKLLQEYSGICQDGGTNLRTNRRDKPGRAFEEDIFDISILLPIGELRDLRRHRMLTNLDPITYDPTLGFFISPHIKNAGLAERLEKTYATMAQLYYRIANEINPYVAAYALPLSTLTHMHFTVNARELHHLLELRTQPGAHVNYKRISQMMYEGAKHLLPLLEETMIFVDTNTEIDYGRALQEIRRARKA